MKNGIETGSGGYRKESPGEQERLVLVSRAVVELSTIADQQIKAAESVA